MCLRAGFAGSILIHTCAGGDGFLTVPTPFKGFDSSVCEECLKHYFSVSARHKNVTICARVQVAVGVNVVPVVPLVMPC